ncbi:hypothetical protein EV424DRAFT_1350218 [Suillus variegatus]|nr:hypothetical protein EV424DRAFT_1350218 [Suillus variegatus]
MYHFWGGGWYYSIMEKTTRQIAVAAGSRVTMLHLAWIIKYRTAPFEHILTEPPLTHPPKQAHACRVHFHDSGHSVMVVFLDSKEIMSWSISPWKEQWRDKLTMRIQLTGSTAGTWLGLRKPGCFLFGTLLTA